MTYFPAADRETKARRAAQATEAYHQQAHYGRPSEHFDWDRALAGMHRILDEHSRALRRDARRHNESTKREGDR